jgi:hypothetical protein
MFGGNACQVYVTDREMDIVEAMRRARDLADSLAMIARRARALRS